MPILIREPDGPYYSPGDERAFYEWIQRISCVKKVDGTGSTLRIHVQRRHISDACLRELLALFHRYDVGMKQLAQFETPSNRHWFKAPLMYWHTAVFEPSPTRGARLGKVRGSRRLDS